MTLIVNKYVTCPYLHQDRSLASCYINSLDEKRCAYFKLPCFGCDVVPRFKETLGLKTYKKVDDGSAAIRGTTWVYEAKDEKGLDWEAVNLETGERIDVLERRQQRREEMGILFVNGGPAREGRTRKTEDIPSFEDKAHATGPVVAKPDPIIIPPGRLIRFPTNARSKPPATPTGQKTAFRYRARQAQARRKGRRRTAKPPTINTAISTEMKILTKAKDND
jgi:hypothetical protein